MSKLKILSGKEVWRILEKHGFVNVRQKAEGSTITVPIPNHPEIKTGTLLSIIRQSNVPRKEFEV